jgi:DNA-binding MarR family transcriptional regulator
MNSDKEPLKIEQVEAQFRAQYPTYQYHFVEFFTEHMADCSRAFGGDLQEMLVLAIIGQMQLKAHLDGQNASAGVNSPKPRSSQITASRIADASGIPRETVRRKLAKLADRGWVQKETGGAWSLVMIDSAARARDGLSDLDSRAIARVAGLHARLHTLLK